MRVRLWLAAVLFGSSFLSACASFSSAGTTPPPGRTPFERSEATVDADQRVFAWVSTYEAAAREWSIVSFSLGVKDKPGSEIWAHRAVGSETALVTYYTNDKACPALAGVMHDLRALVGHLSSPHLNVTLKPGRGEASDEPQSTFRLKWRVTSASGDLWALLVSAQSGPLADWSRGAEIRLKECWSSTQPEG